MRIFVSVILLVLCQSLRAQFGVSSFYNMNELRTRDYPGMVRDQVLPYENSLEVAVHYWFRLPKKRIEFQPTVYFAKQLHDRLFDANEFGIQFKTNVYVFDLGADCNCPTFGKQGPQLQKGLFIQLSPGVASHQFSGQDRSTLFTVGGGVGLDFGVSNLLTLTPIASVRYGISNVPTGITFTDDTNTPLEDVKTHLTTFQLGLQATFRLDKRHY